MEELQYQQELLNEAKQIELQPIMKSSNIAGIGYNKEHNLLKVAFRNKDNITTYLYENVEPEIYNKICEAESIGKTLSECVIKQKEKYKFIKL